VGIHSRLYPSSLNCLLYNKVEHNEGKVEVPLFTTIQFAIEKARRLDVKDHTSILGDWMMSNPRM
jgi:hypothetical protein